MLQRAPCPTTPLAVRYCYASSMRRRPTRLGHYVSRFLLVTPVCAFLGLTTGCRPAAEPLEWNDAVVAETETWRAEHEDSYTRDWVTIEGLHFLKSGTQTAGSAPDNDVTLIASLPERLGSFTVASDEATFAPEPGASITINGEPATSAMVLLDDGAEEPDVI